MTEFEQRRLWMFAVIVLVGAVIFAVNRLAPAAAPAPAIVDVPAPADLGIGDTALSPAQLGESSSSDWAMEGQNPARTRSTPAALNLPLTMQRTLGGVRETMSPNPRATIFLRLRGVFPVDVLGGMKAPGPKVAHRHPGRIRPKALGPKFAQSPPGRSSPRHTRAGIR